MSSEKSPAFQFYPQDFLADRHVMAMTLPARGAYITLLCVCWIEGSLPFDLAELARLCKIPKVSFAQSIWPQLEPCFTAVDNVLKNVRMERERRKQAEWRAMKAAAGKKGGLVKSAKKTARKRKHTASTPLADDKQTLSSGLAKASPPSSSSSLSSSSVSDQTKRAAASVAEVVERLDSTAKTTGALAARTTVLAGVTRDKARPLWRYPRFAVFRWMVDELMGMIGPAVAEFDMDQWFSQLSDRADAEHVLIDDPWTYIRSQTMAEAKRRGLKPIEPYHKSVFAETSDLARGVAELLGIDPAKAGIPS